MEKKIISTIDIGSSSIKMTIFQLKNNEYSILEELRQPVMLGKDSFYSGKISRKTIDDCLFILKKYKKLCDEYKVKNITAFASTAVRESVNVDIFLDNIKNQTDIKVILLSPSKEAEIIYNAIESTFEDGKVDQGLWGIIKIGTGNVDVIILENDSIIFLRTIPLGILRLKQLFLREFYSEENFNNYLEVMIAHELQNLKRDISAIKINKIYGVGFEIRELCKVINRNKSEKGIISIKSFKNFCNKYKSMTEEEIIHKLKIPYDIAETFYPASHILFKLVDFFDSDEISIPQVSLREGILYDITKNVDYDKNISKIEKQIKANALNIGRSLNFDEKHALKVTELAIKIFDSTIEIHKMGIKEKLYLISASILHDIGSALSYRSHHKHSLYIIKEQDLLFFSSDEVKIIANIARYHRKSGPKKSHTDYSMLSNKNKMIVTKLASILRIADSLDNTHLQLVDNIEVINNGEDITINAVNNNHFFSEIYSFKYKKKLFEDFFGIKINLRIIESL